MVISDFGLSRDFERGTLMHTCCGTLQYAAPELLDHKPYTEACDMWAFGVVVYVVLTGCFPFNGSNDERARLIRAGEYHRGNLIVRRVSEPGKPHPHPHTRAQTCFSWSCSCLFHTACEFISRLLVVDPARRLTATQALQDPWMVGVGMPHVDLSKSSESIGML